MDFAINLLIGFGAILFIGGILAVLESWCEGILLALPLLFGLVFAIYFVGVMVKAMFT